MKLSISRCTTTKSEKCNLCWIKRKKLFASGFKNSAISRKTLRIQVWSFNEINQELTCLGKSDDFECDDLWPMLCLGLKPSMTVTLLTSTVSLYSVIQVLPEVVDTKGPWPLSETISIKWTQQTWVVTTKWQEVKGDRRSSDTTEAIGN